MEDLLQLLIKDAQAAKFQPIRQASRNALDVLNNKDDVERLPAHMLRERCLEPLHLALESKTKRLMTHAVSGIEKLLKDERFQSSIETESEDKWLPIQILKTVYSTPNLPEEIQTDVMKLLLKMTFSTAWCMNSRIITQVAQVYIDTYSSSSASLKGIVQAALTQLLGSFAEKLQSALQTVEHAENDVMSDFNAKGNSKVDSLTDDVVTLLNFLTDRVAAAAKAGQSKQAVPLLLEGILAIISNSPILLRNCAGFQQLIWQNLCPTLISLLGIPRAEPKLKSGSDSQRNMDTTNLSAGTAKIIYSISVEITKMVGPVKSLRPVLESLFHRILICSSPNNRHDALKVLKELLSDPARLCDIAVPYCDDASGSSKSTTQTNDLALVKLIIDSVQECCHSSDSALCFTCVMCVGDLLTSIEQLDRGIGIHGDSVKVIKEKHQHKHDKQKSLSERTSSVTSHSDVEEATLNTNNSNVHNGITNHTETDRIEHGSDIKDKDTDGTAAQEICDSGRFVKHSEEKRDSLSHYKSVERQSALDFIQEMIGLLPYLLSLTTIPDVDEALQKFSSQFSQKVTCSDMSHYAEDSSTVTVLNADSIYSTSYSALSLTLNLTVKGYYDNRDKSLIPLSERQFIDGVLDTDMFLYLSPDWLSTVYKCVLDRDLLTEAGWDQDNDRSLITALKDIDGEGSHAIGGQMMRGSVLCDEEETSIPASNSELVKAGKLLACEILSACWSGILDVLSTLLNGKSAIGMTNAFAIMIGTEGAKEESLRKREALCKCLDGLQTAAKLCCSLGLQERCEGVFALLANTSCVMEDFKHATLSPTDRATQKPFILPQSKPKLVRLHAAHVLSMDAMMTTGLEIGSHSADCWKQVFRCCAFISELEHTYFSSGNNQSSLPRIQQEHAVELSTEEQNGDDLFGVPVAPVVPVAPRINVPVLIKQSSIESGWDRSITGGGVLNSVQASQALCGLSQQVDRLFEEAANNLNMTALTAFLASLCESSKHQLHKITKTIMEEEDSPWEHHNLPVNSLHLYRLQNVLMKVAHSDRPLIHLIKSWSVVSSYLVESAGHKDRSMSKMAVTCVHDFIIAVMSAHSELQHFHTNEMLCKTFENILCLELCDGDVQDQIVCSICELVEASASDIRSGWRPLFGALRAVRIEYTTVEEVNEARQRHVEAVLDVFDVYLNSDNVLVFANAMVDCILCLLKYVRGPGEFEDSDTEDTDSVSDYMTSSPESENLVLPALNYLKQCSIILQSMWKMPACPVFHSAKRIQVDTTHRCVDRDIPNMDFKKFSKYFVHDDEPCDQSTAHKSPSHEYIEKSAADKSPSHEYIEKSAGDKSPSHEHIEKSAADKSPSHEHIEKSAGDSTSLLSNDSGILLNASKEAEDSKLESPDNSLQVSLEQLDNHTGILHVWFLMLEGLSGAICACPRSYQPHTMETMFDLLRSASHVPGPNFVVYSTNHLLFPMLQSWLRSGSKKFGYWETGATNFKQCCGHTTDLVVDLLHDFKGNEQVWDLIEEVLRQLLIVLTECVAQPFEVISRLGCSCIRHILLSAHMDFTEGMWKIVIDSLDNALDVTTYCLRQLMLLFKTNSENFYGDIGQVKVATRKDCTMVEFVRMWHLAQQVFLLDSQVSVDVPNIDSAEDKSYVFLLYPPGYENSLNPDHILARAFTNSDEAPVGVPFRSIVVGLLSHQLLLQTVGCILLEGTDNPDNHMPGMLSQLTTKHVMQLLECLRNSYKLACEFDIRPGLKFLLQKVAHTPVAVNLYKQAGASMVFFIHTLIKICANIPDLTKEIVRGLLLKETNADSNADDGIGASSASDEKACTVDGSNVKSPDHGEIESNTNSIGSSKLDSTVSENMNKPMAVKETEKHRDVYDTEKRKGAIHTASAKLMDNTVEMCSQIIINNPKMFVSQLKTVCDELCQTYIDILYDKAGTSCVDTMSDQQLFFLIAQPDEFPELPEKHKVDAKQLSIELEQTQARLQGHSQIGPLQTVDIQEIDTAVSPTTKQEKETVLPPLSPVHSQAKSKREMRTEQESRVYNLATDKLIKTLMTEYKKRKNQNAMPTFAKVNKKDNSDKKMKKKQASSDPVEQVIEEQQYTSIMKDSEAHLQSWTELLCTILGLFDQLDDRKFTTLLPSVFECVNLLTCHAHDMRLREELARWLHRVGDIYTLGPKTE